MALQYNGASLVPDLNGALNLALGIGEDIKQQKNQAEAVNLSGKIGTMSSGDFMQSEDAIKSLARLQQLDPDAARFTIGLMQAKDQAQIAQAAEEAEEAKNYYSAMYNIQDPNERRAIILERAQQLKSEGKDYSKLMEMLNMTPEQQRVRALRNMLVAGDVSGLASQSRQTATLGEGQVLVDTKTGEQIAAGAPKSQDEKVAPAVNALRARYDKFTADLKNVDAAYEKIKTAPESAAGDMSLIFGYMKLLDPGSTVREGEFANAQNTTGIPGQIMNAYNRARSGERLNPNQRKEFISSAGAAYTAQQASADKSIEELISQAQQDGVSPERVLGEKVYGAYKDRKAKTAPSGSYTSSSGIKFTVK